MNIPGLLTGDLNRLRFVVRYSSIFVLHKESVAEHCFYVTLYATMIADELRESGIDINIEAVMKKALFHDMEESRTGDVFRPFKYADPELKQRMEVQAKKEVAGILDRLNVSVQTRHAILHHWKDSKDDTMEGAIVAFADYLSVLSYMLQEINCSNSSMLEQHHTMGTYMNLFNDSRYDFMRPLIHKAREITMEYLGNGSGIKRIV